MGREEAVASFALQLDLWVDFKMNLGWKNFTALSVAFLTLLLTSPHALAQRIDRAAVLFGVEYSFQDQEMVNEQGRMTLTTPYKQVIVKKFASRLASALGLNQNAVSTKAGFKEGYFLAVPNDGRWVVNQEPVTIEVNSTPRHVDEIVSTSTPIFNTAASLNLVPFVNPAAERSGMGHIHIGANSMGENPFFLHPNLLRNVMVYIHKHPSLMHGFAEAYDIGMNSNVETYHDSARQSAFEKAVTKFDAWYKSASPSQRQKDGFNQFLRSLAAENTRTIGFFEHYRLINLQHVQSGAAGKGFVASDRGKLTIEFRGFRPPRNPQTAKAFVELLIAVMEKQSAPNHLEPFVAISPEQYARFNTGSRVKSDWQDVRKELGLNNPYLETEINEYVTAVHRHRYEVKSIPDAELFAAYSQKERKGSMFELRLPITSYPTAPALEINGEFLKFEAVNIEGAPYWLTTIDAKKFQLDTAAPARWSNGLKLSSPAVRCAIHTGRAS